MSKIVAIDPFRCRMWALHDRLESGITEETCRAEIKSFEHHGQLVPVLGRPVHGTDEFDVELIYGARRLFIARHLRRDILVELREVSDREAIVAMDIENRQRTDISPYERGRSYAAWLRRGFFQSQDEIARSLQVSASQVSRLLRMARLPSVIMNAFETPHDICESWGMALMDAIEDGLRRSGLLQRARAIGNSESRPNSKEVFRQLIEAGCGGRPPRSRTHDEVVKCSRGTPVFRIRQLQAAVAILLPSNRLSASTLDAIRRSVLDVMLTTSPDDHEPVINCMSENDAPTR